MKEARSPPGSLSGFRPEKLNFASLPEWVMLVAKCNLVSDLILKKWGEKKISPSAAVMLCFLLEFNPPG